MFTGFGWFIYIIIIKYVQICSGALVPPISISATNKKIINQTNNGINKIYIGLAKIKKRGTSKKLLFVVPGGLEPPLAEPKSVVLPLHHGTIASAKVVLLCITSKFFRNFFQKKCIFVVFGIMFNPYVLFFVNSKSAFFRHMVR